MNYYTCSKTKDLEYPPPLPSPETHKEIQYYTAAMLNFVVFHFIGLLRQSERLVRTEHSHCGWCSNRNCSGFGKT